MPNIWTHIKFAEKVTHDINYSVSEALAPYLNLGAQGPDPFFYHHFWPWKKDKPVEKLGSALHYEKCGPFLLSMIEEGAKTQETHLRTYILGFVTHHLLDRNAHPYIIYRSGEAPGKHQRFEVIIDTLLMKKHHDIQTWRTPVYKRLSVGRHLNPAIQSMMAQLINQQFPEVVRDMPDDYLDASYRDMLLAQRLLFDPKGWKIKLLGDLVSPYTYTRHVPDVDILNESYRKWLHPTDSNESHNESFYDLWDQAVEEARLILPLILDYWETMDTETFNHIKERLGNRSYDTGKDCTLPITNQFFDPII